MVEETELTRISTRLETALRLTSKPFLSHSRLTNFRHNPKDLQRQHVNAERKYLSPKPRPRFVMTLIF
jgi:hypothetical protein